MKKIKSLLITLAVIVLMPMMVFAENEKINVYIFKGAECGYCASALEFFNGLDEEYKSYFNLVEYEVWHDENNAAKMNQVADYFNETVKGVPYIIIGDKTFQGFTESYKEDIKSTIKTAYLNEDNSYQDVVSSILNGTAKKDNSAITIIIIIVAVAGVAFLIYMAREDTDDAVVEEEKPKSEKKVSKEASKTSSKTVKKTATKTTNKSTKKKATTKK